VTAPQLTRSRFGSAGGRSPRGRLPFAGAVVLAAVAALVLPGATQAKGGATTIVVDTTVDGPDVKPADGKCYAKLKMLSKHHCTLRAAIQTADFGPRGTYVIKLPAGTFHLSVKGRDEGKAAKGDLDVLQANVTVVGLGPAKTTIDGAGVDRIFDVSAFAGLKAKDLSITGGALTQAPYDKFFGGAIRVKGTLQLRSVLIENSSAEEGGAIEVDATGGADLEGVTLLHNVAASGAGIAVRGNASLTNVTIAGNNATFTGGGVWVFDHGKATLLHVTIAGNTAPGTQASAVSNGGIVTTRSSIVLGTCQQPPGAHFPSPQRNVVSDADCADDAPVPDAGLLSLAADGNVVPTLALAPSSPAVDFAFANTCPPVDARGVKRPQGAGCDAGAYELVP
jgi:CSLREA domain-containing protein